MWTRSSRSIILLVFLFTGLGVYLVRWFNEKNTLARVLLITHDGQLLSGGKDQLLRRLNAGDFAGIFYEAEQGDFLMPFSTQLSNSVLTPLQSETPTVQWLNIAPDTLFLRSWTKSYDQMVKNISITLTDSLNDMIDQQERLRRLATISRASRRDSLLQQLHLPIDQWTDGQSFRMRKRYARQLLNNLSRYALAQPGKSWLLIIDVEHYTYVKEAFASAKRIEWYE
jgi:hypothetical protein